MLVYGNFLIRKFPVGKPHKPFEALSLFPYVIGLLFRETFRFANFDTAMRQLFLDCCIFDWGLVSPAIFGSLFQSVMDKSRRRNLKAHYTSEKNILKVIRSLFLTTFISNLKQAFHAICLRGDILIATKYQGRGA